MTSQIRCENCGAPMKPYEADVRKYWCEFCQAVRQVGIDSEQLAVGLALDLSNIEAFITGLAASMLKAMPGKTRILHEGTRIVLVELNLDPHLYSTKREPAGHFTASYKKLVRGIALKTKVMQLPQWVEALTQALADHANENAHVAQMLVALKGS